MTEDFGILGYVAVQPSRVYDGQFRVVATPIIREESPVEEFPPPRYRIGRVILMPNPDPARDAEWAAWDKAREGVAKPIRLQRRHSPVLAMQWDGTDDCRYAMSEFHTPLGYSEMFDEAPHDIAFYDPDDGSDGEHYLEIGDWLVCEHDVWFDLTTEQLQARYSVLGTIPDNVHLWASETLAFRGPTLYTQDERELVAEVVKSLLDSFAPEG